MQTTVTETNKLSYITHQSPQLMTLRGRNKIIDNLTFCGGPASVAIHLQMLRVPRFLTHRFPDVLQRFPSDLQDKANRPYAPSTASDGVDRSGKLQSAPAAPPASPTAVAPPAPKKVPANVPLQHTDEQNLRRSNAGGKRARRPIQRPPSPAASADPAMPASSNDARDLVLTPTAAGPAQPLAPYRGAPELKNERPTDEPNFSAASAAPKARGDGAQELFPLFLTLGSPLRTPSSNDAQYNYAPRREAITPTDEPNFSAASAAPKARGDWAQERFPLFLTPGSPLQMPPPNDAKYSFAPQEESMPFGTSSANGSPWAVATLRATATSMAAPTPLSLHDGPAALPKFGPPTAAWRPRSQSAQFGTTDISAEPVAYPHTRPAIEGPEKTENGVVYSVTRTDANKATLDALQSLTGEAQPFILETEKLLLPCVPLGKRGAYGEIYLSTDSEGQLIAVKAMSDIEVYLQLQAQNLPTSTAGTKESDAKNEAYITRLLAPGLNSSNLILGPKPEKAKFIAMKYMPASGIEAIVNATDPIEASNYLLYSGLELLSKIHEKGFGHNDMKLGNMLVGLDADVQISDFGIAQKGIVLSEPKGTYVSPETCTPRGAITAAADIYALGASLLETVSHTQDSGPFFNYMRDAAKKSKNHEGIESWRNFELYGTEPSPQARLNAERYRPYRQVSPAIYDLVVKNILEPDPKKRITAKEGMTQMEAAGFNADKRAAAKRRLTQTILSQPERDRLNDIAFHLNALKQIDHIG